MHHKIMLRKILMLKINVSPVLTREKNRLTCFILDQNEIKYNAQRHNNYSNLIATKIVLI